MRSLNRSDPSGDQELYLLMSLHVQKRCILHQSLERRCMTTIGHWAFGMFGMGKPCKRIFSFVGIRSVFLLPVMLLSGNLKARVRADAKKVCVHAGARRVMRAC